MRFYTTAEVAQHLGVSKRSVERWASDGIIPCVRIKATVRIPETVISSGSIVTEGIIEEGSTNKDVLLHELRTASHFLENAAELFDGRVLAYLDAAVAHGLIAVEKLETVMARLHAFRTSLREVWQAIDEAGPTDIRLRDCGQVSKFASGSMA